MDLDVLRGARLRAHRLSTPASDVVAAARHMTATQAQEFWGGRWALAARTTGEPTVSEVDAAFDRGDLVRAWTQRGTLHVLDPRDLGWILAVTGERQRRQFAPIHRGLGITAEDVARAESAVRAALAGGNRLTRTEFAQVLVSVGIETAGMRGNHILSALCLHGVMVLGPVVPREGAPSRDQYLVAVDDVVTDAATPADPLAELFVRYLRGHGPAGLPDFRWWAGLPLGLARAARAGAGDRVREVDEGLFVEDVPTPDATTPDVPTPDATTPDVPAPDAPTAVAPDGAAVIALPPFEEYYLSYADRTLVCAPEFVGAIGPSANGIVRPVILAGGDVVGVWSHSVAIGKHHLDPLPEVFVEGVDEASVDAALARFARFIRG